jgi:hypothetical protein
MHSEQLQIIYSVWKKIWSYIIEFVTDVFGMLNSYWSICKTFWLSLTYLYYSSVYTQYNFEINLSKSYSYKSVDLDGKKIL